MNLFDALLRQVVGPAQATAWLATVNSAFYRPPSAANVSRFTKLINDGLWDERASAHDPVCFDTRGLLRGGRMRLMAIAASGREVACWVLAPPPPQPHETIIGLYADTDGREVEAIRWDGENFDAIADWTGRYPMGLRSIETNPVHDLRLAYDNTIMAAIYPGDWLARLPDAHTGFDHEGFINEYAYLGPVR